MDVGNWDFKEAVKNVGALKLEYIGVLALFNCFNIKVKGAYINLVRNKIYSLKLNEWQKDRLWEYMNDDIEFENLISILNRQKAL